MTLSTPAAETVDDIDFTPAEGHKALAATLAKWKTEFKSESIQ